VHTPVIDQHRLRMGEDVRILLKLTRSPNPDAQRLAVRALGRYESREFITDLISLLPSDRLRADVVEAIVSSFRGPVLPADRDGQQVKGFLDLLTNRASKDDIFLSTAAQAIGLLPFVRADHADEAQATLRQMLRRAETNTKVSLVGVVRGIEWFARRQRKLSPLSDELIERLRNLAVAPDPHRVVANEPAAEALVAAGAMDIDTVRVKATDLRQNSARRISAVVLGGASLQVDELERMHFLKKLLQDDDVSVRVEAVRAWARRVTPTQGCELLLESLKDPNRHVMLMTVDLLGEVCLTDTNITDRLTAEIKTPPVDTSWHRSAHALVALAKRAPDRVKIPLNAAFMSHPVWQVRMYAARTAAMLKDDVALERLAMDAHDNVREAALNALRGIKGAESDHIFVAALRRGDYQLLRTAANALAGAASTPELSGALMSALARVTAEKKETSRDTRLALIGALAHLGTRDQAEHLAPLMRDFDIPVALAAAALYRQWAGSSLEFFAPTPLPRPPLPSNGELDEVVHAIVEMQNGQKFGMRFLTSVSPLTATRFKRLARAGYYNGLTFHRVVPNFVVQGGSPSANEYGGDAQFMRDEIGQSHAPYTVGLSTRGRDTGDAQFFINLVDNRRLDPDYTVFAVVCGIESTTGTSAPGPGREAVESIREGDEIRSIVLDKFRLCLPR
jgi:cyclophilin family peptidyl-prolyl cis-trans isomerase/HEAT repeat protein